MRLVLDTNVVVSALLWNGTPRQLLDLIRRTKVDVMTCKEMMDELSRVCNYPKFKHRISTSGTDIDNLLNDYTSFTKNTYVSQPVTNICRDPGDDIVLACAVAANANLIVTGDIDLLVMKQYRNIPIVRVAETMQRISFKAGFP